MLSAILSLVGVVIATIAGAVGQHVTNKKNQQLSERQFEQQRQLNQEANETNKQNYLAFQSPAAMVDQLEEAGLNKGLMYSKGASSSGVGTTGAGSAPAPIPKQNPLLNLRDGVAEFNERRLQEAQIKNVEANTKLQLKQADRTVAETEKIDLENSYYVQIIEKNLEKIDSDIERNKVQNALDQSLKEAQDYQLQFNLETHDDRVENMKLVNEQLEENIELLKGQQNMIDAQIEKFKAETKLLKIDARTRHQINQAYADNLYSQTMKNNYDCIYRGLEYMLDVEEFKVHKTEIEKSMKLLDEQIKQAEFITDKQEFTYHMDNVIKGTEIVKNITQSYNNIATTINKDGDKKNKGFGGMKAKTALQLYRLMMLLGK